MHMLAQSLRTIRYCRSKQMCKLCKLELFYFFMNLWKCFSLTQCIVSHYIEITLYRNVSRRLSVTDRYFVYCLFCCHFYLVSNFVFIIIRLVSLIFHVRFYQNFSRSFVFVIDFIYLLYVSEILLKLLNIWIYILSIQWTPLKRLKSKPAYRVLKGILLI